MKDCGLLYPEALGVITGDFNICEPEEGRFNSWNQTFTDGVAGKTALFCSFFSHVLEIAQPDFTRRASTVDGTTRTLSRIDRAFINLPMAKARDFHCYSHVWENLGERSIPSDHAAVRVVIQKPTVWGHHSKRIPSWMSKHPVFCSILKRLHDDDVFHLTRLVRSQNSKFLLERLSSRRFVVHSQTSTLFSKRQAGRLFASSRVRHLTAWEPS